MNFFSCLCFYPSLIKFPLTLTLACIWILSCTQHRTLGAGLEFPLPSVICPVLHHCELSYMAYSTPASFFLGKFARSKFCQFLFFHNFLGNYEYVSFSTISCLVFYQIYFFWVNLEFSVLPIQSNFPKSLLTKSVLHAVRTILSVILLVLLVT